MNRYYHRCNKCKKRFIGNRKYGYVCGKCGGGLHGGTTGREGRNQTGEPYWKRLINGAT